MTWPEWDSESNQPTKEKVNAAGAFLLAAPPFRPLEMRRARSTIDAWRREHQGLIPAFRKLIDEAATHITDPVLIGARLKRLPTIEDKLSRYRKIPLADLQDIAGTRVIVPTREQVIALAAALPRKANGFERIDTSEYMKRPKRSGYAGVHFIYQYHASGADDATMDGLKIELQVRTQRQHYWATTIEVVGMFRDEMLKAGKGDSDWLRLFVLAGSAIARSEGGRVGTNVPQDPAEFDAEFRTLKTKLNAFNKLSAYTVAERSGMFGDGDTPQFYVMTFNLLTKEVEIATFPPQSVGKALNRYRLKEEEHQGDSNFDTVFVGSDSVQELREAYPNYFADTKGFVESIYTEGEIAGFLATLEAEGLAQ